MILPIICTSATLFFLIRLYNEFGQCNGWDKINQILVLMNTQFLALAIPWQDQRLSSIQWGGGCWYFWMTR
jgi:hypothetical protein